MASRPAAWVMSTSSLARRATNRLVKSIQSRKRGEGTRNGEL